MYEEVILKTLFHLVRQLSFWIGIFSNELVRSPSRVQVPEAIYVLWLTAIEGLLLAGALQGLLRLTALEGLF